MCGFRFAQLIPYLQKPVSHEETFLLDGKSIDKKAPPGQADSRFTLKGTGKIQLFCHPDGGNAIKSFGFLLHRQQVMSEGWKQRPY
jgi:hypothetical protein